MRKISDFTHSVSSCNVDKELFQLLIVEISSILPKFNSSFIRFKNEEKVEVIELKNDQENKNSYTTNLTLFKGYLSSKNTAFLSVNNKNILLLKLSIDVENYVLCILEVDEDYQLDEVLASYFETLTNITSNQLKKIHENSNLLIIKKRLESLLDEKSSDVDRLLNQFSEQYSQLKLSYEKRDLLLQEVHHRVNNNLQIISSILNIYQSEVNLEETKLLKELHKRIQALALLHQNFYKSFEKSLIDFKCYLRDLLNYITSYSVNKTIQFSIDTDVKFLPFDTLVPLGLLITEMSSSFILNDEKYASEHPLTYCLNSNNGDGYTFSIKNYNESSYTSKDQNFNFDRVQEVLVDAYMDQLNASEVTPQSESELFCIKF